MTDTPLQIIALGGIREIGKNMWVLRYGDDIIILDAGLKFPSEDMYGVDYLLPDISYLLANQQHIRGVILTHAHEDHVGGLGRLLKELEEVPPVYASELTLGLLDEKLREAKVLEKTPLYPIKPRDSFRLGNFKIDCIHVCHSISGALGFAIHTPVGTVIFTGDFKFDQTPIDQAPTDYFKFAEYGENGVLVLMSDSTNATRPGYTISEKEVAQNFVNTFHRSKGRIIIATFASSLHRIQQIVRLSAEFGRKVAFVGRNMERITARAHQLGYLDYLDENVIKPSEIHDYEPDKLTIITTGSQGEPMAVLSRMANGDYRQIRIQEGDTVVISAHPIPGNERSVYRNVSQLLERGAEVVYESWRGIHASGHASQEELKMMLNLTQPRFFIPMHGEYVHMLRHAELAIATGIPKERILLPDIGDVSVFTPDEAKLDGTVASGVLMVAGSGAGYLEAHKLTERQKLVQDGILVVACSVDANGQLIGSPKLLSKGVIVNGDTQALYDEGGQSIRAFFQKQAEGRTLSLTEVDKMIVDSLGNFCYHRIKRRPFIIPLVTQIGATIHEP